MRARFLCQRLYDSYRNKGPSSMFYGCMDRVFYGLRVSCVCMYVCFCPCSAAPFPFALEPLFRCAAIVEFLATDRCLVPWRVYTDSAVAPCLVLLVFMDRHYVAGRSSMEGPPVPVRRKCRQDMEARRADAQGRRPPRWRRPLLL